MLSDAEEELEREARRLRAALIRERRGRELRSEINRLTAETSAEVSRAGVAHVLAQGAADLFSASWASIAFVSDESMVQLIHGPDAPASIVRGWSEIPLSTDVPVCDVLRGDIERVELPNREAFATWPLLVEEAEIADIGSLVVHPVGRGSRPSAVILIAWSEEHHLDNVEHELLELLVERIGPGFDRSVRTELDGEVASALQARLLEGTVPSLDGLEIETMYEPGRDLLAVGGDWYDVIDLSAGRIAIVIGDVVGHDVRAAIEMTQVRHVLATHLVAFRDPVVAFRMSDQYLRQRAPHVMATALVVMLDADGTLHVASAGHLPPIAWTPDGGARLLASGLGPPLGSGLGDYGTEEHCLEPGMVLVGYTDGVVEKRGTPIDESLHLLETEITDLLAGADDDDPARISIPRRIRALLLARSSTNWRTDDAAAVIVRLAIDPSAG